MSLKIKNNKRAALLAAKITPVLNANEFLVKIEMPEFFPVFKLFNIKTIPFNKLQNNTYNILVPETTLIAANANHETFAYKNGICNELKSITICPNHLLQIRHKSISCAEALVTNDVNSTNLCLKKVAMTKPSTQTYFNLYYRKTVRVFTPYEDKVNYMCGSNLKPNASVLNIGYNDFKFNSKCKLITSELIISSLIQNMDETEIQVYFSNV
jgi:hypothetical protein